MTLFVYGAAPDVQWEPGQVQGPAPYGSATRQLLGGDCVGASDRNWLMDRVTTSSSMALVPAHPRSMKACSTCGNSYHLEGTDAPIASHTLS